MIITKSHKNIKFIYKTQQASPSNLAVKVEESWKSLLLGKITGSTKHNNRETPSFRHVVNIFWEGITSKTRSFLDRPCTRSHLLDCTSRQNLKLRSNRHKYHPQHHLTKILVSTWYDTEYQTVWLLRKSGENKEIKLFQRTRRTSTELAAPSIQFSWCLNFPPISRQPNSWITPFLHKNQKRKQNNSAVAPYTDLN